MRAKRKDSPPPSPIYNRVNPPQFVYRRIKQVCWTQRCYYQLVHDGIFHGVLGQQITIYVKGGNFHGVNKQHGDSNPLTCNYAKYG